MSMQSFFLPYKSSLIHYQTGGKGKQILCCFHGYGESSESFAFLANHLENEFILLCPDLPFHGKTDWKEGIHFTPGELATIITQILQKFPECDEKIYLMGFSLGGRLALSLFETMPEKIKTIILLAADGLYTNRWYWLATQNGIGNRLFRHTMKNPHWLLTALNTARKIKIINPSIHKLAMSNLDDEKIREDLYIRWTTLAPFKISPKKIKSCILEYSVPTHLVYGKYDRIMRYDIGEKFRTGIEQYCDLSILPCGHQVLHEKNMETIIQLLRK